MRAFDKALFEASLCIESGEWSKETLSKLPACKAVLLLSDARDRPIQLLQAANLRRTAQARLIRDRADTAHRKADISELAKRLFYTRCRNNFESQLTYILTAHAVFQETADDWIHLPKLSLAVIDTDACLPFFHISENPQPNGARRVFGLFPARKAAARFCTILNTVFGLCQNPVLLNTGKEATCPYLQMETCPGPCLDSGLRATYADMVRAACAAAAGQIDQTLGLLQEKMNRASQSMRFERAAVFKKQMEQLKQLTGHEFRWVQDLQDLRILHIDIGAKRKIAGKNKKQQLYQAWKLTANDVYSLGTFVPKTPQQVMSFLHRSWHRGQKIVFIPNTHEHLAALSLFLFRSNPSGLWLNCSRDIPQNSIVCGLFNESNSS